MKLKDIPVLSVGGDQLAIAYRAFDHWQKHDHRDCQHDSILDCIEIYAREPGGCYERLGITPPPL